MEMGSSWKWGQPPFFEKWKWGRPPFFRMEMGSATFFQPPYSSQHLFNTILLHHLRHPTFSSVRSKWGHRNGVSHLFSEMGSEMGSATFFQPPYSSQHLFNTILLHHLRHPTFSSVRNTLVFRTLQSFFFRNCQRPV
jgi:hypothetical protein